jgi:hypothetical protein
MKIFFENRKHCPHWALVPERWKASSPSMYKINWDVAIDFKNKLIGVGIILQDCEGQVIAAKCHSICISQSR